MKAIIVLFDSLNRKYLPPYGDTEVIAPNFQRLAEKTVTFDTCYAGSLPCMPARREMHTGRYNFLHRNWGPIEPFDESVPNILSDSGIYTHLVTDHAHYWEDGGCTYHTRFNSWEAVRGQQGDHWKGHVAQPDIPKPFKVPRKPDGKSVASVWRYDWVNRTYFSAESDYPQNRTFRLGLDFIERNRSEDNWMLQIETFDPHEPFIVPDKYKALYPGIIEGLNYDWPRGECDESEEIIEHVRSLYRARISFCDDNLGKVLDTMDEHNLWRDTMLIVCSDHGFLLGEHSFWGKNGTPMYEEIAHTPLFIWDPRFGGENQRRNSLVQTIDFAPTILDYFGLPAAPDMQGINLRETIAADATVRKTGLFGFFGEGVNITDGRYVYMRAPVGQDNAPLNVYTLVPNDMYSRFSVERLRQAETVRPDWAFLKGCPILKVPGASRNRVRPERHLLYDLHKDPDQGEVCSDEKQAEVMKNHLERMLAESDAPDDQYERLGLKNNS